jgi:hypothetical protein
VTEKSYGDEQDVSEIAAPRSRKRRVGQEDGGASELGIGL